MSIYSVVEFIIKFGTPCIIIWGVTKYILECNRKYYNKLRVKLLELQECFQQIDTAISEETLAVLSQDLSSRLFNMFEQDILLALFSIAQPDSQLRRFEPIVRSALRKNKDVQNLIKTCNRVRLLLNEIKHEFPYYIDLLSALSKFLIQYKENKVSTCRVLFILMDKRIANQMKYQLEDHGTNKLTKELFSNAIYQYLSEENIRLNETDSIQKDTANLAYTLITKLITYYISFSNSKLLWISYKQAINERSSREYSVNKDNLTFLFEKVQSDFNSNDRAYLATQIGRLLQTLE